MMTGQEEQEGASLEAATTAQSNWRFCRKCFGLWWNGMPTNGFCPAGDSHDGGGSWNFYLPANPGESI